MNAPRSATTMIVVPAAVAGLTLLGVAWLRAPARSFPTASKVLKGIDMTGKTCLVTGATAGIGLETAKAMYTAGAHVVLVGRSSAKLEATKSMILGQAGTPAAAKVSIIQCDLSDLKSVQQCAEGFLKMNLPLNILINNAGIMALPERRSTAQGLEQQVGVCHVGHFLLTKLLLPALQKAGTPQEPARVVCLSSSAHTRHQLRGLLKNPKLDTVPYTEWSAYGNAKAANLLHAAELHRRYYDMNDDSKNVAAFSVMPGGVLTSLQDNVSLSTRVKYNIAAPFFFKTTSQGAATSLVCATTASVEEHGGKYYDNCQPTEAVEKLMNDVGEDAALRCWDATKTLLKDLGF